MERHSLYKHSQCALCILEDQLRDAYGRVTYSHKTQEKCADTLISWSTWTRGIKIALSAASSVGIGSTFFGTSFIGAIAGGISATILLALNLWDKGTDLGAMAQGHRDSASQIWLIREKYQSLLADLNIGNKTLVAIQARRDILSDELHKVYAAAPRSNSRAYKKALKALKYDEEMTFDDSEIDLMLPKSLRKGTISSQQSECRHGEALPQRDEAS